MIICTELRTSPNTRTGNDTIIVTVLSGGRIDAGPGNDRIQVGTLTDGQVTGGDGGRDTITVTTNAGPFAAVFPTVRGGDEADTITVAASAGLLVSSTAKVNGDGGDDLITVVGTIRSEVEGGEGTDTCVSPTQRPTGCEA